MASMTTAQNDDELEENWTREDVAEDGADDEDVVSLGSEDEIEDDEEAQVASDKKRKRVGDAAEDGQAEATEATAPASRKKQKAPSKGLQRMSAAEHFAIVNAAYMQYRGGALTTLELADGLSGEYLQSHFAAPTGLGKHSLANLSLYMRHLMPSWKRSFRGKKMKRDRSPLFLIISSSALRAVEVLKHLGSFQCKVAKLFAKHLKIEDQLETLSKAFHPIAVGTPGRVCKLLELEALSLEHTCFVIIDMEKDRKEQTILELKDTVKEMMETLDHYLLPRLRKGKLRLVLY